MKQARVKKRCAKCGRASLVRPRVRTCYKPGPMGYRMGYACGGTLVLPEPVPRVRVAKSPQAVATTKAAHALKQAVATRRRIKRLLTAEANWMRKFAYYSKRAAMSDAEIAAARVTAAEQRDARAAQRVRRAVAVHGQI